MSMVTRCPHCATAFRITTNVLEAHRGLVRCGHCSEVFNAYDSLDNLHDAPARSIPSEEIQEAPLEFESELLLQTEPDEVLREDEPLIEETGQSFETISPDEPAEPAQEEAPAEEFSVVDKPSRFGWLWFSGSMLLVILLLGQSAYYWRMELSLAIPGLRPVLTSYCSVLNCSIPLPRRVDLIGIESSSLQAESNRVGVLDLYASIRNSAPFAQAYPLIELTLTDAQDAPLARKVFKPTEYLADSTGIGDGIPANGAASAKLVLDTGSLLPSGYRLYLFYP